MPSMAAAAISVDQAILIPTPRKQNTANCGSRTGRRQPLIAEQSTRARSSAPSRRDTRGFAVRTSHILNIMAPIPYAPEHVHNRLAEHPACEDHHEGFTHI